MADLSEKELMEIEIDSRQDRAEEKEDLEEKVPKNFYEKILFKVAKLTGDEKNAKLIIIFMGFTIAVVLLLLVLSSLTTKPNKQGSQPTPTPTAIPTPARYPTPEARIQQGDIDKYIKDVETFDIEQKDLLPPSVDLKISL